MRANLEENLARHLRHGNAVYNTLEITLTGAFRIQPTSGTQHYFLNPGGVNRTVFLPPIERGGGQFHIIANTGTIGDLTVVDSAGVFQKTVQPGITCIANSSKLRWFIFIPGEFPDAPADGQFYSRRNNAWAVPPTRRVLTAGATFFVRPDGNDANTGLSNTPGSAFLTVQRGIDAAAALDLSIFNASVIVAPGTYPGGMILKGYVGAGPISVVGSTANPSSVIISATGSDCVSASGLIGRYNVAGFTLRANTPGFGCVRSFGGSTTMAMQDIIWDIGAFHILADYGAQVFVTGSQTIIGSAGWHLGFTNKGIIQNVGKTITLVGALSFSFFVFGNLNGLLVANQLTFSGPQPTGQKFLNQTLGIIDTGSGDVNYFPGSVPGTSWSGGYF